MRSAVEFWLCKDEQSFKMKYVKDVIKTDNICQRVFCIETEETVKGFPDVMEIITTSDGNKSYFYEFKISDKSGKIKFQPTQPAFYRANGMLNTLIVAFNRKTGNVHEFYAKELFNNKSAYRLNLKAEVNLNKAEIAKKASYGKEIC